MAVSDSVCLLKIELFCFLFKTTFLREKTQDVYIIAISLKNSILKSNRIIELKLILLPLAFDLFAIWFCLSGKATVT